MAEPRSARRTDRQIPIGRANDARQRPRTRPRNASPRVPWSRKVGVALGLVAVGGSLVLAGSGLLDGDRGGRGDVLPSPPAASASPVPSAATGSALPAPTIDGPATALTRESDWTLDVVVPDPLPGRRDMRLLVYRNERVVEERGVRRGARQPIAGIPLRRGDNGLSVALATADAEGPRSTEVVVTRDDEPPELAVLEPAQGATVNAATVTVRGTAEPGVTISARNDTSGRSVEAGAATDGSYEAVLPLEPGSNAIALETSDAAGNRATAALTVIRGEGRADARLQLSATTFRIRRLPGSISLRALVTDADGRPIDAAPVVFSLSPPGLPTSTYRTETVRGEASWLNVTLPRDGAAVGNGYATAQVTLPDGSVVGAVATFTFR